jgi:hypothetical protein
VGFNNATDNKNERSQQPDNLDVKRGGGNLGVKEENATSDGTILDQEIEECRGGKQRTT